MIQTLSYELPKYGDIPELKGFAEKFGEQPKIGTIISALLPYLFVLAGLGLLVFLILGGFQLMVSGGDPKAVEQAKGKITGAVIGFLIIFIAFWLVQILQVIFGLPKVF